MNFESQDEQSILYPPQKGFISDSQKEDIDQKATNHKTLEAQKPYLYGQGFQNSPKRGSYFFTPTSPKPIYFGNVNHLDSSYPKAPAYTQSAPNKSTIQKQINLEDDFSDIQEYQSQSCPNMIKKQSPDRSSKNAKGLKCLSQSVYMIVSQLSNTKYKDVADILVNQLVMNSKSSDKRKDQHNVKRRVYDALNVLISAGLIRKQGKEVICNKLGQNESNRFVIDPYQMRQKQRIQQQLKLKHDLLNEKREKLDKLQKKKQLIEYIINRNKIEKLNQNKILRFPLIGFITSENVLTCQNLSSNSLTIKNEDNIRLYGDMDLLLQINKQNIQMDSIFDNICYDHSNQDDRVKIQEQ